MNKRQRKKKLKKIAAWYKNHYPWYRVWISREELIKCHDEAYQEWTKQLAEAFEKVENE